MNWAALALESTLISHGLPYPQNLQTARELEGIAQSHQVQPRTIAVIEGHPRIGLEPSELELLATSPTVHKLARRDLPLALTRRLTGATTVSATMFLAHRAGLCVLSTGGIGGVHRENPRDISADLIEFTRTPVAVVCAGAKAILDLPATLEFLETFGVPVIGFGTDEFPAFYTRSSGLPTGARLDTPQEVAALLEEHWKIDRSGGVLVVVPIPSEHELPAAVVAPWIEQASSEAVANGITGKEVTPYILSRLAEISQGATVRANIALLKNNVAVASQIALALAARGLPAV